MLKNLMAIGCVNLLLAVAVGVGCSPKGSTGSNSSAGTITIHGAGSTFVAPLFDKWFERYHQDHPNVTVDYQVVGSGEGTTRFLHETVDFGASDAALTDEQIAAAKHGAILVPITAGMIVLAYNPEGMPPQLKLSRDVYADIFLGKIEQWNDPRIAKINPDANLPARKITVVARRDDSGTTFAFTNHLAAASEAWKQGPGVGKSVAWPEHTRLANGNESVGIEVKRDSGTIGYVDFGTARSAGLGMATLENKAGNYIQPSGSSGLDTLIQAKMPENLRVFIPDPDGADLYPIVTYSWLLIRRNYDDPAISAALKDLIRWCLNEGQVSSESLGYLGLAPKVVLRAIPSANPNGT